MRLALLPMLVPAIVASGIIVFAISMDDFVISAFLSSGTSTDTVPVRIYSTGPHRADARAERARDADARAHDRHRARRLPALARRARAPRPDGLDGRRVRGARRRDDPAACASSASSEHAVARRPRPSATAPSMCMCPNAGDVRARPVDRARPGRRRSGPKRVRPPMPNVAAYAPRVHSSADQSVSMRSVARERLGADERRHPLEDRRASRLGLMRADEIRLLAGEERAEHADRRRRRRVVVQLADEPVRREALARETVLAPERLVVDGEELRDAALRARLLQPHPPGRKRGLEADRRRRGSARPRRSRRRADTLHAPGVDLDAAVATSGSRARAPRARRARRAPRPSGSGSAASRRRRGTRGTAPPRRARTSRPRPAIDPEPLEQRERVRGLRQEAVREVRARGCRARPRRRPPRAATRRT